MTDVAIRVDRLSKQYRIGRPRERYRTLRDVLTDAVLSPFRRREPPPRPQGHGGAEGIFQALSEVSFEVKHGEVLGIVGRNGAGKSTLLKILSRITEPDSGRIDIYGRVASLLEVGTGFHAELTGRENLYLSGAILGMKRAEINRKFDEIVAFAEVDRFIDTPVKHYSSGMYLRLAFAVAAHLEPEILLVDEVLAVMRETATALRADPQWKDRIVEDLEVIGVDRWADSSVILRARFKVVPAIQQWNVKREYLKRLKAAFDARGIEIPFPQLTVHSATAKP